MSKQETLTELLPSVDYEEDYERSERTEWEGFFDELDCTARRHIQNFFAERKFHCGGPIPQRQLFSQESIELVLNTGRGVLDEDGKPMPNFIAGMDRVYRVLSNYSFAKTSGEISFILTLLEEVRGFGIPIVFQSGIVLLFLKYCKGCDINV